MNIVRRVARTVQSLLSDWSEDVGEECGVIVRKRKFSASTLAQTFVLGFLQNPNASDEDLAQMAGAVNVPVTPQAVEQRYSATLVQFLQGLFCRATQEVVQSRCGLAPLLERFSDVLLLDSTTITLPAELAEQFPGCGGSHGGGAAAVKLQVQLSLKTGALDAVRIESGRDCDLKTPLQNTPLPKRALRVTDLGYFKTAVFDYLQSITVFWLSRRLPGTNVYDAQGRRLHLMQWLSQQGSTVDQAILLGSRRQIACRLIAWRMPPEVANRRRQKLLAKHRRQGTTPTAERLAWCDWTTLVTNVPAEILSVNEACVLYRARWQIELLFKRWKSQGRIAELSGSTVTRQMVRLWARLLAVVLQHWLLVTSVWGDARHSLKKACDAIRPFGLALALAISDERRLIAAIQALINTTHRTARQNKRKKPSTFELLNHPDRLEYSLT